MHNTLPLTDRNLILTGYTGPNPPRIGQMISERLRLPYINIDLLITDRTGLPQDEVRQFYGESRLKAVESDLIEEARLRRQTVIRVGARTLLRGDHLARLAETGPVICLVTTLDAVLRRLHIAMGGRYADPNERAREIGELRREWAVRGLPGVLELDTTTLDAEQTLQAIIDLWREHAISRA
jgi:shikimate kinase